MAEAEIVAQKQHQHEEETTPTNIFSLFPKFELKFPFFGREKNVSPAQSVVKEEQPQTQNNENSPKPNFVVSFPNTHPIVAPPIDVELEESSGKTHNPLIIWQVYALAGFIIVKWVWARWKERNERANKKSAEEEEDGNEESSDDQYQSPADGNDSL